MHEDDKDNHSLHAQVSDYPAIAFDPFDFKLREAYARMKRDREAASKALTYDDGKAPLACLPWAALDEMAMVQEYGHKKYGDFYNYRKGMEVSRNLSCAIRHIRDYMNGLDLDSESGRSHLAHAMVRIAYVIQNIEDGVAIDDRFTSRKAAV